MYSKLASYPVFKNMFKILTVNSILFTVGDKFVNGNALGRSRLKGYK
jgi:hypothetical protein